MGFKIINEIYNIVKSALIASNIYLFWILIHYVAPHLYSYYCVHYSLLGFLMSPFLASTPYCKATRWIIYNGANAIDAMWIFLGTWIISKLNIIKTN